MDAQKTIAAIDARLREPARDLPGLSADAQLVRITDGAEHIFTREELGRKLASGRQLRVKLGIDPTGTQIHVGHFVVYRKLRQFQRLGHHVQFVIGSFTAMIGDPSDKLAMRQPLTQEQVAENFRTYRDQLAKFFAMDDPVRTSVRENGEWFFPMTLQEFLPLLGTLTVSQMLERENFKVRYERGTPIGIHEFTYPLLQGWDSVMLESDVELGGTDQLFNCLRGRDLQADRGMEQQVVLTMPLLLGTDGRKMSKSYGNFIALTDEPAEAYGKLLAVADEHIPSYARSLTEITAEEWAALEGAVRQGANMRDVKMLVARAVVAELHGWDAADAAERTWVERFSAGTVPTDLPEVQLSAAQLGMDLPTLLVDLGLASSKSEARRLVDQGGVRELTGGEERKLDLQDSSFRGGTHIYRIGKKHFLRTVA